ncbi:hypothetical protein PDN41_14945 [Bacillus cereus]|uniref:hypothetical protein n=1 Tax=Bacillus cereus group TaxID=86661 RepID=UPI000BF274A5|nr:MULTISPECIES: hypothetical protein [Bacillus cereus group]MDA2383060.1 hypothetical protein [Bacillus cereus]MDA2463725.1 hypothetical protein [Bacillus cereus]NIL29682.1 hypothetical protein [Bacillus thuringiensis]PFH99357.1 hypothetical protein COI64_23880 [Bacillus cereus]PFR27330.1 hypothetical protein COK22_19380 [Bacillus cereus]
METVISDEIIQQFKDRMHLGDDEDANLKRILFASNEALLKVCGLYDINKDETFKELVFERSRYAYNDALEYFTKNFLTEINSFGIAKALEEIKLDGE